MLCGLIMAGGKGERFWPLSTEERPKQFLNLIGEDSMIQMTVKRLEKLIPVERIFIVTGKRYVDMVKEQLTTLPERNIIVEPIGRNTAPCIALSAFYINKFYEDATIAVLPSDHLIENEDEFINVLSGADEFIEKNSKAIVTIGIKPTRAETNYGYIRYNMADKKSDNKVIRVEQFVEKPDKEKADLYLESGNYLWNAGMFVWKSSNILDLTELYLNRTYEILREIAITEDEKFQQVCDEKYIAVDSISVDYGIMEKAKEIYVIPSDFGWDDIGSWGAVERYSAKDKDSNVCKGKTICVDGKNNLVLSTDKKIILSGIDNVLVVESDDVIMVINKSKLNNIKELKDLVE
jgi:mannose-1-phosphate guanylyltransferase